MNRILLITAALLQTALLYSQKPYNNNPKSGNFNANVLAGNDTLYGNFFNGTPALYQPQGPIGGYASGNNGFGDKAKAQTFSLDSNCAVNGAIIWMGYKNYSSGNGSSKLSVNLYSIKTNVTGQGATALKLRPDSIIQTKSIDLSVLDTGSNYNAGANIVIFNSPQIFDTLFAIGIDFSGIAPGDTVACYTTTNTDADSTERAWEQAADSNWYTMLKNWGLDVDFAIFPIVDYTQTGINENKAYPAFTVYPNPATDCFTINTENQKGEKYWATVVNYLGQTIYNQQITDNNTTINTDNLPPGIYYIIVRTPDNHGVAKPIVVK